MKQHFHPVSPHGFANALQSWFAAAMRPLPWRAAYEPYSVWISEIMLQQTQMERGVDYFNRWMRQFPTVQAVADADESAILAAWEGLGYYSRARNVHKAAKIIATQHGGVFPSVLAAIRTLPGVGEYTAGAITAIAFNQPEPAVDANVLRIFSRLCDIDAPTTSKPVRQHITEQVKTLMPADSPRVFCQALMELGALVCGKTPRCGECPVLAHCLAHANHMVAERPTGKAVKQYTQKVMVAAILTHNGNVAVRQRPASGLWPGLWEFLGGDAGPDETPDQAISRHVHEQTGISLAKPNPFATVKHGYTTVRVTLHGYSADIAAQTPAVPGLEWKPVAALASLPFAAGPRKLLEHLGYKKRRQT